MIYPVAAKNDINIQLSRDETQVFSARITDMLGRTWLEWKVATAQKYAESTDISRLPTRIAG